MNTNRTSGFYPRQHAANGSASPSLVSPLCAMAAQSRPEMLRELSTSIGSRLPQNIIDFQTAREHLIVTRFIAKVEALGSLTQASPGIQARLLEATVTAKQRQHRAMAGVSSTKSPTVGRSRPSS
jgi:hypothetical protein